MAVFHPIPKTCLIGRINSPGFFFDPDPFLMNRSFQNILKVPVMLIIEFFISMIDQPFHKLGPVNTYMIYRPVFQLRDNMFIFVLVLLHLGFISSVNWTIYSNSSSFPVPLAEEVTKHLGSSAQSCNNSFLMFWIFF